MAEPRTGPFAVTVHAIGPMPPAPPMPMPPIPPALAELELDALLPLPPLPPALAVVAAVVAAASAVSPFEPHAVMFAATAHTPPTSTQAPTEAVLMMSSLVPSQPLRN